MDVSRCKVIMAKERGLFRIIFSNLVSSLRPNFINRKLVGEDFYGTKYYEETLPTYSRKKRPPRYFVPKDEDNHEQELPAEWEAWLRYRRQHPPSDQEVEENYKVALAKKENALRLEKSSSGSEAKPPRLLRSESPSGFPIYEEYENFGAKYKPKPR